jgi:predicted membrane GTPase involved in stress response
MNMVDAVLLVVDSVDGPKPQVPYTITYNYIQLHKREG